VRLAAHTDRSARNGIGRRGGDAGTSALPKSEVPFGGELGVRVDDGRSRHTKLRRQVACGGNGRSRAQRPGSDRRSDLALDLRSELLLGTVRNGDK